MQSSFPYHRMFQNGNPTVTAANPIENRSQRPHHKGMTTTDTARARAEGWLARVNLRPTRQRVALATLLVGDGRDRHVTAEGLHDAARRTGDKVSLATVYNTLRAFSEAGLVQEITVDGTGSYFDTRLDDHPHFYWEADARLSDAGGEPTQIVNLPEPPEGMEIAKVDVVIRLRPRRS
jgi:Fur family iron response transcriptional regulator